MSKISLEMPKISVKHVCIWNHSHISQGPSMDKDEVILPHYYLLCGRSAQHLQLLHIIVPSMGLHAAHFIMFKFKFFTPILTWVPDRVALGWSAGPHNFADLEVQGRHRWLGPWRQGQGYGKWHPGNNQSETVWTNNIIISHTVMG